MSLREKVIKVVLDRGLRGKDKIAEQLLEAGYADTSKQSLRKKIQKAWIDEVCVRQVPFGHGRCPADMTGAMRT